MTISDIYFPEFWKETGDFLQECRKEDIAISKLGLAVLKAGGDSAARQSVYDSFSKAHRPPENRYRARDALRDAARALLERIMNVDEGT